MKAVYKLIIPFYSGCIDNNGAKEFSRKICSSCQSFSVLPEASKLFGNCDRDLRREYLEGLSCSFEGAFVLKECYDVFDPLARFELDVFNDGIAILVVTFSVANGRKTNPEHIYRAHTCLIESIYRGEAKLLELLNNVGDLVRQCSIQDSENLRVLQKAEYYGVFGFFFPIIVIFDEDLSSSNPDLLRLFISPDYERINRVQKSLDIGKYLAERFGELVVHASWEATILHGKVDLCEVTNYDVLTRFIHHVWYSAYLLDNLASNLLDDADKIASSDFVDLGQRLDELNELLRKIRALRRKYVLLKNDLLDFTATANMNMRFVELLKYGYDFSNMDFLLKSAEAKLNILHNDQSMLYEQLQQRRLENQRQGSEMLQLKLNMIAILFGIFGSIAIIDMFFNLIESGSLNSPFGWVRVFFEALPIPIALIYYFYLKRTGRRYVNQNEARMQVSVFKDITYSVITAVLVIAIVAAIVLAFFALSI